MAKAVFSPAVAANFGLQQRIISARGIGYNGKINWPVTGFEVLPDSLIGVIRSRTGTEGFDLPTESEWKSARRWKYYARLIEGIRKEIPDMRFAGLPCQEDRPVPGIKVKDLEHVDYCQYNHCYYHGLEDPDCGMNARSMREFRAWAKQAPLGLYGYEFDIVNQAMYLPMWRVFEDEMRIFSRMKLKRVKTEYSVNLNRLTVKKPLPRSQVGQFASRLAYHAWAMSVFDPDLDMDELLDD